jgi:hypothetical protein
MEWPERGRSIEQLPSSRLQRRTSNRRRKSTGASIAARCSNRSA